MLNVQDSVVLEAMFQAASAGGAWPQMLAALADYLHADTGQLFTSQGAWDSTGPVAEPTPEMLTGLRTGRVYTGEELQARALTGHLIAGFSDMRALGLRLPSETAWILALRMRGTFRAVDSAALSALGPHLLQALSLARQIRTSATRSQHADDLLRRLGLGRLEFDPLGRCIAQDTTARDLLARADMTPAQLSHSSAGLHQLTETLECHTRLLPDGGREIVLRATDLPLPAPAVIAQALGLTLAEARLARALGHGARLSEAAQTLGITVETARFYSKQIFAKTGLRGQADLMRRLWSGLLALR